ncbi:AraC family transcriptional regulator [Paenibacillus sp. GCM10023252]|uniref:AraC family transcriptional regulator n=1 Tax=Paenibacillus sp. GCM10023252 TaxID=3252649 RepID=UPI0036170642
MFLEYIGWSDVSDPDYDWRGWSRKEHSVCYQYTLSGQGVLENKHGTHVLRPGQGFLVEFPGSDRYYFDSAAASHWEFIWIQLSGGAAHRFWGQLQQHCGPVVHVPEQHNSITILKNLYRDVALHHERNKYICSLRIYEWIMSMLEWGDTQKSASAEVEGKLEKVKDYIFKSYHEDITLEKLAKIAGLAPSYFCTLFHEMEGITPFDFVLHRRMEEAVRLLRHTDLPIQDISDRTGYSSSNYFTKVFRKHMGCTPTAFRSQRSDYAQTDIIYN